MEKFKLSIIIVDYNASRYLVPCLLSLKKFLINISHEIIIVDNASRENHLAGYKKNNLRVKSFRLEKNLGFGGGNNYGAQKATGEYLLLLNPDTLLTDDSIQKMVSYYDLHEEIGALTCLLYQENGKDLQSNFFGPFQSLAGLISRHHNGLTLNLNLEFQKTSIVSGACLLIKRQLFERVGGFDEKFFMYLEDDDLCKRISDLGYENGVLTIAKIIHLEGKSSTNKVKKEMYYKSQNYYWQKHLGLLAAAFMRLIRFPYKLYKTKFKP